MADYENVLYEKQRQGVLITLNRPDRLNAISPDLERELHEAFDEAEADPEVRAIVLTGAGRAFSSGYDISGEAEFAWPYALPEGTSAAEHIDHWRMSDRRNRDKFLHMWELSKPVIAAVHGWCMGGGSWYAVAAHMTFADTEAVFAQPEVRHMDNTSFFWILNAGYKNGLRYSLTGDHIDAQEALRIGIANKVVEPDQLLEEAFSVVERIALVSPETVKINLAVATMGLEMMGLHKALTLNAELSALAHTSVSEEGRKKFTDAQKTSGLRGYLQERDGPFQPEPFGPRSRPRE